MAMVVTQMAPEANATLAVPEGDDASLVDKSLAIIFVGIFGTLTNLFAIVVMLNSSSMRRKLTVWFIIHQSCIDGLASVFLTVNVPTVVPGRLVYGISGFLNCFLWQDFFFVWSLSLISTTNLVVITIERYLAVIHPIFHKTHFNKGRAKVIMALVWTSGPVFNILQAFSTSRLVDGVCLLYSFYPSTLAWRVSGVGTFLAYFVVPVSVMCFCYSRMALSLRKKVHPAAQAQSVGEQLREKKMAVASRNIFKTLVVVAFCYVCCWTVSAINYLLFNFQCCGASLTSTAFSVGMFTAYLNNCVNPVVYTFQYKEFQQAAKQLLTRRQTNGEGRSLATTSTT